MQRLAGKFDVCLSTHSSNSPYQSRHTNTVRCACLLTLQVQRHVGKKVGHALRDSLRAYNKHMQNRGTTLSVI